jgi:hypothetical protein
VKQSVRPEPPITPPISTETPSTTLLEATRPATNDHKRPYLTVHQAAQWISDKKKQAKDTELLVHTIVEQRDVSKNRILLGLY